MASHSSEPPKLDSGETVAELVTSTHHSAPISTITSRKRPRQSVVIDDMDLDDFADSTLMRKSKKATNVRAAATQPYSTSDTLAGPSSIIFPRPRSPHRVSVINQPAKSELFEIDRPLFPLVASGRHDPADGLQGRLDLAHREISLLKEQLEVKTKNQEAAANTIRQSMMLDMIRDREINEAERERNSRKKWWAVQRANEQEAECEKQRKKLEENNKKYAKALVDVNFYKDEVEHVQALNKAMEEDLEELRRIENEDRIQRLRHNYDLPPAYGSLDEDDVARGPRLHHDSGSFDVAAFKRSVRNDFLRKLDEARLQADALREGLAEKSKVDVVIFKAASAALADASRSLRAALNYAENMYNTNLELRRDRAGLETQNLPSIANGDLACVKRLAARRDFVGDRVAKLLVDLAWRVISATELWPAKLVLSLKDKTTLCLAYKEADDCLLDALRQAFTHTDAVRAKTAALWEYQNHFTQLCALRRSFNSLGTGLGYSLFTRSGDWLCEQIEQERMCRAELVNDGGGPMQVDAAAGRSTGSEVSSAMSRTESDSSHSASNHVAPFRPSLPSMWTGDSQ